MRTPRFIVTYRLITVLITAAILLVIALGTVGIGPLAGLIGPSAPKIGI